MDLRVVAWVALGGALGAVLRYLLSSAVTTEGFPWGTLAVNAVGSLVLGFLLFHHAVSGILPHTMRAFVSIGILGAFTTMSTFSYETIVLYGAGEHAKASLNVALNMVLSIGAALIGRALALWVTDAHLA